VWLHGEAVAAGMCMAAALSARLGWISAADVSRIETLIQRAGLPVRAPASLDPAAMLEVMAVDKKAQEGMIRLVLLKAVGDAVVTADYDSAMLREVLDGYRQ
jgi:3-dehydroquinate synthase